MGIWCFLLSDCGWGLSVCGAVTSSCSDRFALMHVEFFYDICTRRCTKVYQLKCSTSLKAMPRCHRAAPNNTSLLSIDVSSRHGESASHPGKGVGNPSLKTMSEAPSQLATCGQTQPVTKKKWQNITRNMQTQDKIKHQTFFKKGKKKRKTLVRSRSQNVHSILSNTNRRIKLNS